MDMIAHDREITLDEAIAHFEAIVQCAKLAGQTDIIHSQLAGFLYRLKRYERAFEEIFSAVDEMIDLVCAMAGVDVTMFGNYAELKKKYTEDGNNG